MYVWKIEVFENKGDSSPIRKGYVKCATEDDAVTKARVSMGSDWVADRCVASKCEPGLPENQVVWLSLNEET